MNLKRNAIFNTIAIVAIVALFAGTPVIADHQSFAIHFPRGYTKILHFWYFGPCVNWGKFMYLICYKQLP